VWLTLHVHVPDPTAPDVEEPAVQAVQADVDAPPASEKVFTAHVPEQPAVCWP